MDAVIKTGGKQYRVTEGQRLDVELLGPIDTEVELTPVLLVDGVRLGCLNHALLSAAALRARGIRLAGWVANRIEPSMREADANVAALVPRLPAPLAADIGWGEGGTVAARLDLSVLRGLGLVR